MKDRLVEIANRPDHKTAVKRVKRYQVHVAYERKFRPLLTYRRAQRAVRLLKHIGFPDAYIAGSLRVDIKVQVPL